MRSNIRGVQWLVSQRFRGQARMVGLLELIPFMAHDSESAPADLRIYVNDMVTLDKHILEAVEHQIADERMSKDSDVAALLGKLKSTLTRHIGELEGHIARLGSETGAILKQVIGGVAGSLAGLYDKIRKDPVSRMVRDDYTALNMASISYTMLHTTALAHRDEPVAQTALTHLQDLTPIIMRFNEIVPQLVVKELAEDDSSVDTSIVAQAVSNTQAAWK